MRNLERNPKQAEFLNALLNNKADFWEKRPGEVQGPYQRGFTATFQGPRGNGKTVTLLDCFAICAKQLPGACIAIAGKTYLQVQNIILQQMEAVFRQHDLTEYSKENPKGQYVLFKAPPPHFRKPHNPPKNYDNVISFVKGAYGLMVSADRPITMRGANWDVRLLDESGTVSEDFVNTTDPSIRANKRRYHDTRRGRLSYNHPLHWAALDFTSMPRKPSGQWIFKTEENMKKDPDGFFFLTGTAKDNAYFLPGNFIASLKAKMTDLDFRIEVLNERISRVSNAFYPALDVEKHGYLDYSYEVDPETKIAKPIDRTYDPFKELIVGWDFNSYFTSLLVCQEFPKRFRFIDCMFIKESNTTLVNELTDNFIDAYKHHLKKVIRIRGDQSGKRKDEKSYESSYAIITRKLKAAGWEVIDEVQLSYPSYMDRHIIVNSILNNENPQLPVIEIHEEKCKSLLLAMQMAAADGADFAKDKRSEKSTIIPQEQATHLTDIFDYIICKSFARYVIKSSNRQHMLVS